MGSRDTRASLFFPHDASWNRNCQASSRGKLFLRRSSRLTATQGRSVGACCTMAGPAVSFHTLRLTYFDGPGRADPVRWALRFAGIEFEDERLSIEAWDEMRESGERDVPLLQLPLLTVNTVV